MTASASMIPVRHGPSASVRCAVLALLLAALVPSSLAAQSPFGAVVPSTQRGAPATERKGEAVSAAELQKRLSDAQAELAAVDGPGRLASGAPPGTPEPQLQARVRALRLMVFSYRQHINALGNLSDQQKLAADSETKRRAWSGLSGTSPYSVVQVDGMRSELQAGLLDLRSEEARLRILAVQRENAKEALAKAAERHRQTQEALEATKAADLPAATWHRDLAALELRAQGVYLESLVAMSQTIEARIGEFRRAVDFVRRKLDEAEKSVRFLPEDLVRLKADIDERRARTLAELERATGARDRLSGEVDKAIASYATAERHLAELQRGLGEAHKAVADAEGEMARAEKAEGFLQKVNPFRGRAARAELDKQRKIAADLEKQLAAARALMLTREREQLLGVERSRNAVQVVESLNTGLITLDMQRTFWDLRYAAYDDRERGAQDRRKMVEGSRRLLKVLDPAVDHVRAKLEVVVGQLAEQQGAFRVAGDAAEQAYRKAMVELLTERERTYLVALSEIEEVRHLLLRWLEEEDLRAEGLSAGERVRGWFGFTDDWLKGVWTFELFAVQDSIVVDGRTITGTRGVTVAKVVQAILIVVVGYLLAAAATRLLMGVAIRRGRMEETGARIARKWILAVTLVMLLLLALDVVKIPLTAFAFLGGAIAIGAGFGMQTLLKNLISGVMLLMERPFKPRDIVEVGSIRGEVTDINVRSCTIRDVNGIETLVPNSTFLEQNVTNWTLSNRKVRYTLNLGVGYGSPVRKVSDLLLEVAQRHNQVLDDPAPEVLFTDFGDNALMFALNVWLEVGPGRRSGNVILSDLRFMIDACFADNGIEIPYPQRDVHLDARSPVPVRVVPETDA